MPIAYLDVPPGIERDKKKALVKGIDEALHDAYPFPDVDAKRRMLKKINDVVAESYQLPDFMIFIHEYPLELVAHNGDLHWDNAERVEAEKRAYS